MLKNMLLVPINPTGRQSWVMGTGLLSSVCSELGSRCTCANVHLSLEQKEPALHRGSEKGVYVLERVAHQFKLVIRRAPLD